MSRLALGTLTWGRDSSADEAAAMLGLYRDAGGTTIDTADSFSGGAAERILGGLLAGSARHELVVITGAGSRTEIGAGSSRRHLLASLAASLHRLGTDHVDLWQLHQHDPGVTWEETLAALDHAVVSGQARYVGVSNLTGWQAATAATWQRSWPGRARLASVEVEWSLLNRGVEAELVPAAAHHGLGVLAWSPLGRGVLTGKYRHGVPADSRGASADYTSFLAPYLQPWAVPVVDAVATAAQGLGCSPLAVALAWVRDQPAVAAAVAGARTTGQLRGVLAAEELDLPAEIRAALDDVSQPPRSDS